MYRTGRAASLGPSSLRHALSNITRTTSTLARSYLLKQQAPQDLILRNPRTVALALRRPFSTSLQRYATHPGNPFDKIDKKHEEVLEREELEQHPEEVSTSSSTHQIFSEKGVEEPEKEEDMLAGVKADIVGSSLYWSRSNLAD